MNSTFSEKLKVDLLDEDKPIANQKFVCLSFISPEKILKQKDTYLFEKFVQNYDFTKSMKKFNDFLAFVSFKYNIDSSKIMDDLEEFVKEEKEKLAYDVSDDYKTFLDNYEEKFTEMFQKEHEFQTCIRGIKVRGTFPTQEEAELRCKVIRKFDPNHDVYVGPVGLWVPFHPEAYKTGNVQYLEKELNDLMNEKNKNEKEAKEKFDQRVKESKVEAIEENIKKAKENNTTITQSINEQGELVNIKNMNTQESKVLGANATSEEIRRELFEGENVIVGSSSNLQSVPIQEESEESEEGENEIPESLNVD